MIQWPDFGSMTKQEAIDFLLKRQDPKLERLVKWIAEAEAFSRSNHGIRIALAEGERMVESLRACTPRLQADLDLWGPSPQKPAIADDSVLGEWVYCAQHLRPHQSGWCTVSLSDKVGLGPAASVQEAAEKCRRLGLKIASE